MCNISIKELLGRLGGVQTIASVMSSLKVSRQKAIYHIYRLRKYGYVKTKKTSENKRVYYISFENKLKGTNYADIINKYSPIKVSSLEDYKIYGKQPGPEEALVYAIKSKDFRLLLASLSLFRKITNWPALYKLLKSNSLKRQAGALYDAARRVMRTRKMAKRFRKNILPEKGERYGFIIDGLKSDDFKEIERLWRVYVPFNKEDLRAYRQKLQK
ncbi:hypothetical protein HYT92_01085 [Candidatus Pacearchaeota archaeon]|nr:hypothetical protein [Candidatus Pacearchaeota archaeon]